MKKLINKNTKLRTWSGTRDGAMGKRAGCTRMRA